MHIWRRTLYMYQNENKESKWYRPKLQEPDDDEGVEATGLEDLILGDAVSAANPGEGREEAAGSEGSIETGNVIAVALRRLRLREAARVVDGGVRGLLLEDGEE